MAQASTRGWGDIASNERALSRPLDFEARFVIYALNFSLVKHGQH